MVAEPPGARLGAIGQNVVYIKRRAHRANGVGAMTSEVTTLVTEEMIERKGEWGLTRVSPPVSLSDIRKWAIAVYWPEEPPRLFRDEEYAGTTRFGGIVAPQDFNPFAWPVRHDPNARAATLRGPMPGRFGMNGGQTDTYGVPMRPGDVITSRRRLQGWEEREGRLGLTLYIHNEDRWENQNGQFVKSRVSIQIRY